MNPTRIYLGHGAHPEEFARHLVRHEIAGGATVYPTMGLWRDDNTGEVFDEDGAVVELFGLDEPTRHVLKKNTIPVWLREHDELSALVHWPDGSTNLVWREAGQ